MLLTIAILNPFHCVGIPAVFWDVLLRPREQVSASIGFIRFTKASSTSFCEVLGCNHSPRHFCLTCSFLGWHPRLKFQADPRGSPRRHKFLVQSSDSGVCAGFFLYQFQKNSLSFSFLLLKPFLVKWEIYYPWQSQEGLLFQRTHWIFLLELLRDV